MGAGLPSAKNALSGNPLTYLSNPTMPDKPNVAAMVESIVGCKWSLRLLGKIASEPQRPANLLRSCRGLSAKVMNERLRKFQRFGLVSRHVHGEKPPIEVEYALTPLGGKFVALLGEIERLQQELDG